MKKKFLIVQVQHRGELRNICNFPYNSSEIDTEDETEVDRFFIEEYSPYYKIIKESIAQRIDNVNSRYYFNESSACSRLYGLSIRRFCPIDVDAIFAALEVLNLIERESCFVAEIASMAADEDSSGLFVYIARSYKCLVWPPSLAVMIQKNISDNELT